MAEQSQVAWASVYRRKAGEREYWAGKWRNPATSKWRYCSLERLTEEERDRWRAVACRSEVFISPTDFRECLDQAPPTENELRGHWLIQLFDKVLRRQTRRGWSDATVSAFRTLKKAWMAWLSQERVANESAFKPDRHLRRLRNFIESLPGLSRSTVHWKLKQSARMLRLMRHESESFRKRVSVSHVLDFGDEKPAPDEPDKVCFPVPVICQILEAAKRYDEKHHRDAFELLATYALTAMRTTELLKTETSMVQLVHEEDPVLGTCLNASKSAIMLPKHVAKGKKKGRRIRLHVSEGLSVLLLRRLKRLAPFGGRLFPDWTVGKIKRMRKKLIEDHGAPPFAIKDLRSTCSSYLCSWTRNGRLGIFFAAGQLGHTVAVCEKHYATLVDVDPDHTRLEDVLGIADLLPAADDVYLT